MDTTKLTVRVPRDLLENTKRFAAQNNTTLTALIEAFLRRVSSGQTPGEAAIVRRLSGILPPDLSEEDYRSHLDEKYGS